MNNSCLIVRPSQHQPLSLGLFKPRKRKFFKQKNVEHTSLVKHKPKCNENSQVNAQILCRRQRSRTKQVLVDLFAQNVSFFFRLNTQKSAYEKLFSRKESLSKKTRRNNLERTRSTKIRPQTATNQSFEKENDPFRIREQLLKGLTKLKRPKSCKSTVHSTNLMTLHSQI